jgi:Uma2 family endonuclease
MLSSLYRMSLDKVSDRTLEEDRVQAQLYGRSGIAVSWIVDVNGRRIEVYSNPEPAGYLEAQVFSSGQNVPVVLVGAQLGVIRVDDVLP